MRPKEKKKMRYARKIVSFIYLLGNEDQRIVRKNKTNRRFSYFRDTNFVKDVIPFHRQTIIIKQYYIKINSEYIGNYNPEHNCLIICDIKNLEVSQKQFLI